MAKGPRSAPTTSRRTMLVAIAVAAAVAGALVAMALLLRDSGSSNGSPTLAVDLAGIPQDGAVLGDPEATVRLIEYADVQCPFCAEYAEQVIPTLVTDYVRPGKVSAEFRVVAILGGDSEPGARYVIAAGLQDRMWEFQEALFRNQGAEHSGWLTEELVREVAAEIPGLDVDKLMADADTAAVQSQAEKNLLQFQADGAEGTPTTLIDILGDDDPPYMIQIGLDPAELSAALDDALQG